MKKQGTLRSYSRRIPRYFFSLFIYINRNSELEFNDEFIIIDGNLFNQPSDKRLVVFVQDSRLLPQECVYISYLFSRFFEKR